MSQQSVEVPFFVPALSSFLNGLIFAPLEFGSTRSKSVNATTRSFSLLKEVCRTEGVFSMWKGSSWFIFGNAFSRGVWLTSYNCIGNKLKEQQMSNDKVIVTSGFISGGLTALVSNPFWTIKSYAQLPNYPGFFFPKNITFKQMIQNHPSMNLVRENRRRTMTPTVLMAGVTPAMTYNSIESVIQLFTYEKLKQQYKKEFGFDSSPLINGVIGGISRMTCLPLTYPLHVLTLRYRESVQPKIYEKSKSLKPSFIASLKQIHSQRAWYSGLLTYSCRVVPQATILFFIYESFIKLFGK